jgi:hypothetical protein
MVYLDTSVLVALFTNEPKGRSVARWYSQESEALITGAWSLAEFASALSIKQRTRSITSEAAHSAWLLFEEFLASDLRLIEIEPAHYRRAAKLVLDASSGLRAGDALHLACAESIGAKRIATLDKLLSANARRLHISTVQLAR